MSDALTAYEMSLSPDALYTYMQAEARQAWPVMKGPGHAYNPSEALGQLIRDRPQLYERYTRLVQRGASEDSPLRADLEAVRAARHGLEALRALEEEAKSYGGGVDGMTAAVGARPDLYRDYSKAGQSAKRVDIKKEGR